MIYFETKRLVFRDWEEGDLELLKKMNRDPEVMRYFPSTLTGEDTEIFYERIQEHFKQHNFGLYVVETKEDREFIGFIGLLTATFEAEFTPCVEIGWRLRKEAWNKGYATEGAKACLQYGFDSLSLDKIYSFTAEINTPSENVMKKIGMIKVGEFPHPKVEETSVLRKHVLYCVEKKVFI